MDIEEYLRLCTENWGEEPIFQAAKYSLLSPGKRIRPLLAIEAFTVVGGEGIKIIPYACALEMIHAASLIMDDIMDNDDYRRGKLACHKKFGINTALMASQFLTADAYALIVDMTCWEEILHSVTLMCVGQAEEIDEYKTGALIKSSVWIGAFLGGATISQLEALTRYGEQIGLLFQVTDDIIDGERSEEKLSLDLSCLDMFGPKADRLREIARFIIERTK